MELGMISRKELESKAKKLKAQSKKEARKNNAAIKKEMKNIFK
jgi:hypothetical protein